MLEMIVNNMGNCILALVVLVAVLFAWRSLAGKTIFDGMERNKQAMKELYKTLEDRK